MPIVVTPGDPAGVGPEILLQALSRQPDLELIAVADSGLLRDTADALECDTEVRPWRASDPVTPGVANCLHVPLKARARPGQPDPANGGYVLETIDRAVDLVTCGGADALVTGPVSKAVICQSGTPFSGHTEYLAKLAGVERVVMMLAAPGLRVTLVTTHLPLRAVADAIDIESVAATIRITHGELKRWFRIEQPQLQVLGLNPHAGEGGQLGLEDIEVIAPAIAQCREQGMTVTGPVPADTAFTPPRLAECDAVVAMYHDQGLPVLKHMGFSRSVNVTLGLPFIRTSVDHGTAFDIAGSGRADCSSLLVAIAVALEMAAAAG
jgi:4-hydroxythreonine-4-phosphate dehydrogenase